MVGSRPTAGFDSLIAFGEATPTTGSLRQAQDMAGQRAQPARGSFPPSKCRDT
jgi:hypothetical protein